MADTKILDTKSESFREKIKTAPQLPGCYLYKDPKGKVLYVGKAKIIRNRVKSYFSNYARLEPRIQQMIDLARRVDFVVVDSEAEALILEANLIKKYNPKYNVLLRDGKYFVYVKIDKVIASKDKNDWKPIPTISIVREKKTDDAYYFGPYPEANTVRRLTRRLRRVFPYCNSNKKVIIPAKREENFLFKTPKPCFEFHIGYCNGICAGYESRGSYEQDLNNIKRFFRGDKVKLIRTLEREMQRASKNKKYERAANLRDRVRDLKYVGRSISIDRDIDEVALQQKKKEKKERALTELIERLQFPDGVISDHKQNFKIECYDISNIQGTNAVGSMVVFVDGQPKPDLYRRFKIRTKNTPDDFAMLQEVLTRRFNQYLRSQLDLKKRASSPDSENSDEVEESTHISDGEYTDIEGFEVKIPAELKQKIKNWKPDESFSELPDLMIIDGGKGQLSSTYRILTDYGLHEVVPIVGLAKREEEIFKVNEQFAARREADYNPAVHQKVTYLPQNGVEEFSLIRLPRRSEALYLVQRIRDEAHRFAITYHRKLRSKQLTQIAAKI